MLRGTSWDVEDIRIPFLYYTVGRIQNNVPVATRHSGHPPLSGIRIRKNFHVVSRQRPGPRIGEWPSDT